MEQLLLLRAVREAAERASPGASQALSQSAFDTARASSPFPALPAARNIARSLGVSWPDVVSLSHEDENARTRRLGIKQGTADAHWLTEACVAFALRLVARRLGTRSLSARQYIIERECLLAADHAHWLHGRRLFVPSEGQVIGLAGSWSAALRLAGLAPADHWEGRRAPSLVDLLERFHEHYGTRPVIGDLMAFARGNGIPFPITTKGGQSFGEGMAAWRAKRAEEGLPTPQEPPPFGRRPDYARDVGAARPEETRLPRGHDEEGCVAWMRAHLEGLAPGARSTQRAYRAWATGRHGAPSVSTIERLGGFAHVRLLAQESMRGSQQGKGQGPTTA